MANGEDWQRRLMWAPTPQQAAATAMSAFMARAGEAAAAPFADYAALHAWSIAEPAAFWRLVWDFCGVIGEPGERVLVDGDDMLTARWFPEARLNFAENLLRPTANDEALLFRSEDKVSRNMTRRQLRREVARCAAALRSEGVGVGDCVAAWAPNMPETLILMLAAASIGAVFTSASPDFGVEGVLDRFGQTQPLLLLSVDGYWYKGRAHDMSAKLAALAERLPGLRRLVTAPLLATTQTHGGPPAAATTGGDWADCARADCVDWADFLAPHAAAEPSYLRLPFAQPLYILYSSGTTGAPKCIVHGAGGTLLQHLKEHRLHTDLRDGDRLFYFTTCGWMMWNWLVSGLASGATLLLYDGDPFAGDGGLLWDYAEQAQCSHFGTSAKYLDALAKSGLQPAAGRRLDALRVVLSTGSPLAASGFDFVHQHVSATAQLASISGGADIISCFILGNPLLPVRRGQLQCAGLGMAVQVWDDDGAPLAAGARGELVCTRPFPSMPTGFWNDARQARYRAAYFEHFPGVWRHGDYCERTADGGYVIYGRSDATLNPGGVRIGTAEIYRQVEHEEAVLEALVIGQQWPPQQPSDVRVVLFVRLREGLQLDATLSARLRQRICDNVSPRHAPAKIIQVDDIPRTRSGKIVELAVRDVVHGRSIANVAALANPQALEQFRNHPELSE